MTRNRGISPKKWFYDFKAILKTRQREVRQRLAGAAAEQWLNVEFFCWLQKELRLSGLPYVADNEFRKSDVAVLPVEQGRVPGKEPLAVMEAKAIYSGYDNNRIRKKLEELLSQLEDRRAHYPSARVFGLIYGIFACWEDEPGTKRTFAGYRRAIKTVFLKIAKGQAKLAKPCMEEVFEAKDVPLAGGVKAHIGMCAQYVELAQPSH